MVKAAFTYETNPVIVQATFPTEACHGELERYELSHLLALKQIL
jgi:hypothetical protein